jgi:Trk K+ transport system NAD-binding subunit
VAIQAGQPESGDHIIICGANALTSRTAEELTLRYALEVTAVVASAASGHGARLGAMPGVRLLERPELSADTLLEAGLQQAQGLAILHQDDLGNFHAALRAQEINPQIRMVIAISNAGLGERIRTFFADCAVLSESQMAASSLVAAALGEPAPSHVRIAGRTMYVARRENVAADQVICGLAANSEAEAPQLVPASETSAGLVLAVADGTPRNPLSRRRQRRLTAPIRLARRLLLSKIGLAFAALLAVMGAGFALQAFALRLSGVDALYLTLLDAAGAAVTQQSLPGPERLAQVLLTFDGMAFLPLVTAVIVGSRIPGARASAPPPSGHVIVAGLGEVGTRIVGQLHDLGIDVVGIDKSADATGMPMARRLGVRVVIGETHREETLRAAGIGASQALVSVTDSDIVNLETALNARALAAEPRIVVRLYDDDLAERVQMAIGNTVSRSTSYLAAPAFAAAVLDHQVLRTIAVGRHVLLLAEVAAVSNGGLARLPITALHEDGLLRVIAVRRPGGGAADWSPAATYQISAGDRLIVLATRAGLSGILRRNEMPRASTPGI